jgi:6-phosphogluconolactonase
MERHGDVRALSDAAARFIADRMVARIQDTGRCSIALAGGSTPRPVYQRLAEPDLAGLVDWSKVLVRWGDERCVPPDSAYSNYAMALEALLNAVPIPAENIIRIKGELPAEQAACLYADKISGPLDIVVLGVGEDGHTASLFTKGDALKNDTSGVLVTHSPVPPTHRVSLSMGKINEARTIVFLVVGAGKAKILGEIFDQRMEKDPCLPAAMVSPTRGELRWFADRAASARIYKETWHRQNQGELEN